MFTLFHMFLAVIFLEFSCIPATVLLCLTTESKVFFEKYLRVGTQSKLCQCTRFGEVDE